MIVDCVEKLNEKTLKVYEADRDRIKEDFGIEQALLAGGYCYRQVLELVQNGADAILEANDAGRPPAERNKIQVLLRGSHLYVANSGAPLSEEGVNALLHSHSSPKRGNQIGRFGLGFKSLLLLGGKIDVFTKTSDAIRFSPQRCQDELKEKFQVAEVPALRLAWPLASSERTSDPHMEQFFWAETVVRVEVQTQEFVEHLRQEISTFPAEFLLFFPVTTTLFLDDGSEPCRELGVERDGNDQVLRDGIGESRWRVVTRDVTVTDERAINDATHIHARKSVPLAWAVPLEGKREESGRFWAFFPTNTPTHVPGILNAPWKLNNDRNAIIGGDWNTVLMREGARLITDTLSSLSTPEDPARPLDAFPRQMERKDEDAAPLVEAVWSELETAAAIPDATGTLRSARDLYRHPRETADLAQHWQALANPDELKKTVHSSCLLRQRGSRLNALAERLKATVEEQSQRPDLSKRESSQWFAGVASTEIEKAIQVLKLAEAYANDCKQWEWDKIRPTLAIIPSREGCLMTTKEAVFASVDVNVPDRTPVALELCEDADAKHILSEVLKVREVGDKVWMSVLRESLNSLSRCSEEDCDTEWKALWDKLRAAPGAVRGKIIEDNRHRILVRRLDGEWVLGNEVLLPGALVSAEDTSTNRDFLVDKACHENDEVSLIALGVSECPEGSEQLAGNQIGRKYRALEQWLDNCRDAYDETHSNSARLYYLLPSKLEFPEACRFLLHLSGTSNANLTEILLARLGQGEFSEQVEISHSTPSYPKLMVSHPLPWFVLKHGTLPIGDQTVILRVVVDKLREPVLAKLNDLEHLMPVLEKLKQTENLQPVTDEEIRDFWLALIETLATPAALADDSLRELWSGAAKDGFVPESLPAEGGDVPLPQVFVSGSPDLAHRARKSNRIVVSLDDEALNLWTEKGAKNLSNLISPIWASASGPVDLLSSVVPELADLLHEEVKDTARCQPVSELELSIGDTIEAIPCLMWENKLLLDTHQLGRLSRAERLKLLVNEVAAAGWLKDTPEDALQQVGDAGLDERRAKVASGGSLAEKLLLAVGEREEPLRESLGELASAGFLQKCTPLQIAELTLGKFGPGVLSKLREALEAEGLRPPSRWNTSPARSFVASIGFPEEFASSQKSRREPEEIVSGPIKLPPLHDFQEEVLKGIRELVDSGTSRRRAVVSLPTGGGKTRVMVEAAVLHVLKPEHSPKHSRRSVVWIAQTDELCEQAVQAFRQVWLNLGAENTALRVIRMWGGHLNPSAQESNKPVVLVASIQTLNSRMDSDSLAWLQKPGLVVVDECHHGITKSYTNLLRWLDAEATRPGVPPKKEPPIIGLSATPFRMDDEESKRLAKRFDNRWFPSEQERLYARLREQGVLAEPIYEKLESGIGLSKDEEERLSQLEEPWDGYDYTQILEEINQRLAGNDHRNRQLVECIHKSTEQSILFFANSVLHANEMSVRLNLAGISSAAISGKTPPVARRYFLNKFQSGDIRVICNHSVLTTGFDAPKTDMILISRQVFSPVRYMQIVGRGLRGEKNGGTSRCRIVTVMDNLGRFQDKHPYHYCERYYRENSPQTSKEIGPKRPAVV